MVRSLVYGSVLLSILLVFSACGTTPSQSKSSLYDRLGGKKAIDMVVSDFVDTVGSDQRIKNQKVAERLAAIDINNLKRLVSDQVCMAAGGPCTYTGRDMKTTHKGLEITEAEWGYVVDDLVKTLNKYKVPDKEQQELLALLGPMKGDIVEVK